MVQVARTMVTVQLARAVVTVQVARVMVTVQVARAVVTVQVARAMVTVQVARASRATWRCCRYFSSPEGGMTARQKRQVSGPAPDILGAEAL